MTKINMVYAMGSCSTCPVRVQREVGEDSTWVHFSEFQKSNIIYLISIILLGYILMLLTLEGKGLLREGALIRYELMHGDLLSGCW